VERLGILGGTFDPVHVGHLAAGCAARHQLQLTRVMLVVAGDPWQKRDVVVAPAEARYDMVAAAVAGVDGLEVSRLEIDRPGETYTIDTATQLAAPDRELVLIVGSDVAASLDSWVRADDLRELVTLGVVDRDGSSAGVPPDGWRCEPVSMPRLDIASSDLRRRIAAGEPVDFLVPSEALRELRARNLYTAP
jgi:nicotinate-nucleotide adenylyltransferase